MYQEAGMSLYATGRNGELKLTFERRAEQTTLTERYSRPPLQVMRAIPERGKVIVDGVNVAKKHQKATKATMQGGIIDKDMPLHVSNVAIVCTSCGKHSRIGYRFDGDTKVRVCRKCGKDL